MSLLFCCRNAWIWLLPLLSAAFYGVYRLFRYYFAPSPVQVRDRTVLITGASSGLGRALAFRFHQAGARLILVARSLDKLKSLCEELQTDNPSNPHPPQFRYLDLSQPNGVAELNPNGRIDILINNAGQSMRGSCESTTLQVQRQIMDVNYFGQIALTQGLMPFLSANGSIVLIGSIQGRIAVPYRSAYSASKHAIQAYFDSLRGEQNRLHILTISPGYINTNLSQSALTESGERSGKNEADLRNGMTAEFVAEVILAALIARRSELVVAPFVHRMAILLRYLCPDLFFYVMRKRAEEERKKQE